MALISRELRIKCLSWAVVSFSALVIIYFRTWMSLAGVLGVLFWFQSTVMIKGAKIEIEGGFVGCTRITPCKVTHKRSYQLYYSPLPPDIQVLWDGIVIEISKRSSYKVRLVRSGVTWLAQRTESTGMLVAVPVSTRCPVDHPLWTTMFICDGEWPNTVIPPRNVEEGATWGPTVAAKKSGQPPMVVQTPVTSFFYGPTRGTLEYAEQQRQLEMASAPKAVAKGNNKKRSLRKREVSAGVR